MSSANGRVLVAQDPDVAHHLLNHICLIAPIIGADTELGVNQHETVAADERMVNVAMCGTAFQRLFRF